MSIVRYRSDLGAMSESAFQIESQSQGGYPLNHSTEYGKQIGVQYFAPFPMSHATELHCSLTFGMAKTLIR